MLLEEIETLFALAEAKTMVRAASKLNITQSAVSKRISRLEETLGKKLIQPHGRNVNLTPEALSLIRRISPVFYKLTEQIYQQVNITIDNTPIKIEVSESIIPRFFKKLLTIKNSGFKNITIETHHPEEIINDVESGNATIGLYSGEFPVNDDMVHFHLYDEKLCFLSKKLLTHYPEKIISPNQIDACKYKCNFNTLHHDSEFKLSNIFKVDSYFTACYIALNSDYTAVVPVSLVDDIQSTGTPDNFFVKEMTNLSQPVYLCVRKENIDVEKVSSLIEILKIID